MADKIYQEFVLNDLSELLQHQEVWAFLQQNEDQKALVFQDLLQCLSQTVGMDPIVRAVTRHVEFETKASTVALFFEVATRTFFLSFPASPPPPPPLLSSGDPLCLEQASIKLPS